MPDLQVEAQLVTTRVNRTLSLHYTRTSNTINPHADLGYLRILKHQSQSRQLLPMLTRSSPRQFMTEPRSMEPMSTICHGAGLVFKFMKVDETAPSRSPACRWTLIGLA